MKYKIHPAPTNKTDIIIQAIKETITLYASSNPSSKPARLMQITKPAIADEIQVIAMFCPAYFHSINMYIAIHPNRSVM